MDADEKLLALKKAYADIILSISKEAATRVMTSEKKSVRYQLELKVAKEEGVRMLLRLKQMMDSQISEAEAASLNQQKKIDELEAQLQEAEDIVRDLRDELGEVQSELERVKNDKLHYMSELGNACSRGLPEENKIYRCEPTDFVPSSVSPVPSDVNVPYTNNSNECNKCYSNMVCACGAYNGNRELPSIILRGKEPGLYRNGCTHRIRACERNLLDRDLCLSEEADKKNGEEEEGKDTLTVPASGSKTLSDLEKKLLADITFESSQSFLQKRKRAIRRRKSISVKSNANYGENASETGPRLSEDKDELQNQAGCEEASEKEDLVKFCSTETKHEDGVYEKLVPLDEEIDCKMDVEKVDDVSSHGLGSSLSNATEGHSIQPSGERVIKYTFQRKRKRQAFGGSELNGSVETEKKTGDVQNGDKKPEQQKSSLLMESSRDNRRLVQVARQLISLSERKWWH